jgi:hypothetical protein
VGQQIGGDIEFRIFEKGVGKAIFDMELSGSDAAKRGKMGAATQHFP